MIHQFTLYTRLYSNKIYYLLRLLILQQIMEEKLMPLYTYNIHLLWILYHGHSPYLAHCCKQDNMVAIVSVGSIWLFIWGWFSFLDMPPINWGHRRFRKFTHVWINGSYKNQIYNVQYMASLKWWNRNVKPLDINAYISGQRLALTYSMLSYFIRKPLV